jgi:DNA-binding MarR family transcriptional regulator
MQKQDRPGSAMTSPEPPSLDLTPCNCLALRQAARRVTQLYESYLAPLGLRSSQYSVLARLARLGPMSINELADGIVMDRTTMGRAIRPLERDGLVRIGAGDDGRKRVVSLTPAGMALFKKAVVQWRKAQKQFESAYGEAPATRLRNVLKDVVSAIPETGAV